MTLTLGINNSHILQPPEFIERLAQTEEREKKNRRKVCLFFRVCVVKRLVKIRCKKMKNKKINIILNQMCEIYFPPSNFYK